MRVSDIVESVAVKVSGNGVQIRIRKQLLWEGDSDLSWILHSVNDVARAAGLEPLPTLWYGINGPLKVHKMHVSIFHSGDCVATGDMKHDVRWTGDTRSTGEPAQALTALVR